MLRSPAAADDGAEGGVRVEAPDAVRVHRERLHAPLLAQVPQPDGVVAGARQAHGALPVENQRPVTRRLGFGSGHQR